MLQKLYHKAKEIATHKAFPAGFFKRLLLEEKLSKIYDF